MEYICSILWRQGEGYCPLSGTLCTLLGESDNSPEGSGNLSRKVTICRAIICQKNAFLTIIKECKNATLLINTALFIKRQIKRHLNILRAAVQDGNAILDLQIMKFSPGTMFPTPQISPPLCRGTPPEILFVGGCLKYCFFLQDYKLIFCRSLDEKQAFPIYFLRKVVK